MGLTYASMKKSGIKDLTGIPNEGNCIVALAGNPNTGKSSVFNALTGLHQHTGNWSGKTVVNAQGEFIYNHRKYTLVDLPGTYSLSTASIEEAVAKDFILNEHPDVVLVVADATCLERNLNLLFQIMEIHEQVILCINLIDEAKKKNMLVNAVGIEQDLGIPVILTSAPNGMGIPEIRKILEAVVTGDIKTRKLKPLQLQDRSPIQISNQSHKEKTEMFYTLAEEIAGKHITNVHADRPKDEKIDQIVLSKKFGMPLMLLLLGFIIWITIIGANIPSKYLGMALFGLGDILYNWLLSVHAPNWLSGFLVLGLYRTLAWVVSVMLPPMAIFFPLFSLLEDFGYLPRIAFNLDHLFKKACAHGKQSLTMCMGLGCNAAGVVGCRIIESPRERLIAILTNNFMPCNGRFPTLIAVSSIFFAFSTHILVNSMLPAITLTLLIILGILTTLCVSYTLSKTLLVGIPSTFTLELPPYRKPQIGRVLYTSLFDRTLFVLGRAVCVAAPAGAVIWILANTYLGNASVLTTMANFLDPLARSIGLDGFIFLAFILGLPANEIVLPILLMAYLSTGSLTEYESLSSLKDILLSHGWTYLTALNMMLFSLLHWPCSTTLWTIKKETGSLKWSLISILISTVIAFGLCFITTCIYRFIV